MKRLLLICMLLALAMAASGLVSQVAGLSSGPGAAQATGPDEAFLRSVALIGQSSVGYAVAGPSNVPFGTLSMGPTEAEAYAWSLAQTGQDSAGVASDR